MAASVHPRWLADQLNDDEYSDLLLKAEDGSSYHCHKVVVCPQSDWFACGIHEIGNQENGRFGNIIFCGFESTILEAMLSFMYRGNYDCSGGDNDALEAARFHTKVHRIASFYHVEHLVNLAASKFAESLEKFGGTVDPDRLLTPVEDNKAADLTLTIYSNGLNGGVDPRVTILLAEFAAKHIKYLLGSSKWKASMIYTPFLCEELVRAVARRTGLLGNE